ncbi:hypothetical protein C1645_819316 [Glomus cerebriforme]|uniref:Uncharacterized protein n=1 Tax=Glomus cerebriforme TaxID=658196 RepID=A0A397TF06_9GLOM|nr:hypothetical protein C1645_819316 [Glomus cerebriforme]
MLLNSVPKIQGLNLLRDVKVIIFISRRADHMSTKEIKAKLLASKNGANGITLSNALNKPKGYILYYQQPNLSFSEDSPQRFCQLTLSDELWLKNALDYGQICIRIDGKYDLNLDHALILSIIANNNADFANPIAFVDCNHAWYYENLPDK